MIDSFLIHQLNHLRLDFPYHTKDIVQTLFRFLMILILCLNPISEISAKSTTSKSSLQLLPHWRKHPMDRFCSCGLEIAQQKFCQHDFVFAVKRVNKVVRSFNDKLDNVIPDILPYRGQIFRFKLLYSFQGILLNYTNHKVFLTIHVTKGYSCGLSSNFQFPRQQTFIISGFQYGSILLVTSCSWVQPFSTLTAPQTIGLFQGLFQHYCYFTSLCQINFYYSKKLSLNRCEIKTTFRDCYDKYAICHFNMTTIPNQGFNKTASTKPQCSFITDYNQIDLSSKKLNNLPDSAKSTISRSKSLPFNQFIFCLRVKLSNISPWRF